MVQVEINNMYINGDATKGSEKLWTEERALHLLSPSIMQKLLVLNLTHYSGRVTQICVFNTVKLGTSASSP